MEILNQEVDVFDPEQGRSSPYTKIVFAKHPGGRTYRKMFIEVYKSDGLDISRFRYDPQAIIDGTVDRYYPMGYESKIKYEGELPAEIKRAMFKLALDENEHFYKFFEE